MLFAAIAGHGARWARVGAGRPWASPARRGVGQARIARPAGHGRGLAGRSDAASHYGSPVSSVGGCTPCLRRSSAWPPRRRAATGCTADGDVLPFGDARSARVDEGMRLNAPCCHGVQAVGSGYWLVRRRRDLLLRRCELQGRGRDATHQPVVGMAPRLTVGALVLRAAGSSPSHAASRARWLLP